MSNLQMFTKKMRIHGETPPPQVCPGMASNLHFGSVLNLIQSSFNFKGLLSKILNSDKCRFKFTLTMLIIKTAL